MAKLRQRDQSARSRPTIAFVDFTPGKLDIRNLASIALQLLERHGEMNGLRHPRRPCRYGHAGSQAEASQFADSFSPHNLPALVFATIFVSSITADYQVLILDGFCSHPLAVIQ